MSRARRLGSEVEVTPFPWSGDVAPDPSHPSARPALPASVGAPAALPPATTDAPSEARLAEVEREAFAKGYEQGEKAGGEAAGRQVEERLQRMTATLDELATLRQQIVQGTERQMVELALTVARRILRREVSIDGDLVIALARVALDRLGERSGVTIRLHPQDYAIATAQGQDWSGDVKLTADESVAPGGCRVESDAGFLDAGIDAQLEELERAVLGDEPATAPATTAPRPEE